MLKKVIPSLLLIPLILSCGGNSSPEHKTEQFKLENITIGDQTDLSEFSDVDPEAEIILKFSEAPDENTLGSNIMLRNSSNNKVPVDCIYDGKKTVTVTPQKALTPFQTYTLVINPYIKSAEGDFIFTGKTCTLNISMDYTDKFKRISDDDLLTLIEEKTFNYFWDFGHPVSGMARERTNSGNTVTTGGTGFGIMAICIGAERGFVTRAEACERIGKIVSFLKDNATTYHGAFAHWMNGETGATIPFSTYDNGADIVETSFLFEGLLTARSYFDGSSEEETQLRNDITTLWKAVEWNWFTKDGTENQLYWHWSPDYGWKTNMAITGWDEALITYVLAASSPDHSITKEVYNNGWARNGAIKNGKKFYDITLPLGNDYGGPLFFTHYSFLGLNPHLLKDTYADYWEQNTAHAKINYEYCVHNPGSHAGYSRECWGLTASDGNEGYSAYSPSNDKGVIAPTAALSSMPYVPEESKNAMRFFYYKLGDKIFGDYGFIDAFNLSANWFDTNMNLAIDEGPIIIMLENYRTGLIWNTFMKDEDVKHGLAKLGFTTE
ncbi:MAG: Ig-like domain-containing protein [Bacteroidales bacterium]|jgi:hypothetical protein|nr:Ig-like domain-containing protein [Bacteroidales bacterium]